MSRVQLQRHYSIRCIRRYISCVFHVPGDGQYTSNHLLYNIKHFRPLLQYKVRDKQFKQLIFSFTDPCSFALKHWKCGAAADILVINEPSEL